MIEALTIAAGVIGAAYGGWLRVALARGTYRLANEFGPVPARWWLVPVAASGASLLGWHLAGLGRWGVLPAYAALLAIALPLAAIDLEVHRLPDRLTLPAVPAVCLLLALDWEGGRMVRGVLCALLAGIAFLLLALAVPGGLGLGDVKLAVLLGLALGWWGYFVALQGLALGFIIGGLVSLTLICLRRATRHTQVAFGPSLLVGALGALLGAG